MASVYIVPRDTRSKGMRYSVRCEMPNRPILRLGTFGDEKQAWSRKLAALDLISKHPSDHSAYNALTSFDAPPPPPSRTLGQVADAWLETLQDLADGTVRGYRISRRSLPGWLCEKDPSSVTFDDLQRFATERSRDYKRSTISKDMGVIRQALDHAGLQHNPARGRRIRLPREAQRVYRLPTRAQLEEIHRVLPARSPLMTFLEHTGLRIEEAAALRWADFDWKRDRFLVPSGKTVNSRRWVEHLPGTPDFPRPTNSYDRRVFERPGASSLTGSLRWAHFNRGAFRMSSHEFRHLHASRLLHDRTLSPAQIAARLGHANPSMTLTTYSHVLPPDD